MRVQRRVDRLYQTLLKNPTPALTLTAPRLKLTQGERERGEALLETFGAKHLPTAYGAYEKAKEAAQVIQQVFGEDFHDPQAMKETSPEWESYCKVLRRLCERRMASFDLHDQLCHYYILHKMGLVDPAGLAKADGAPLEARLPGEELQGHVYEAPSPAELEEKYVTFADKYMPESLALHRRYARERAVTLKLLAETLAEARLLDAVRTESCQFAGEDKVTLLTAKMDELATLYRKLYMDHRIGDLSADDLAKRDHETVQDLKTFTDALPSFIAEACKIGVAGIWLVKIPGRNYRMGRTEVTQAQWEAVMGSNPSDFKGPDRPVENVSWNDCQAFIEKLNGEPEVKQAKLWFRLPTVEEWEHACRAGGTGDWGRRRNGEEGPLDAMGWYWDNSGRETHPVAQKAPNAWGLYDMHGNVGEWTSTAVGSNRLLRGGSWSSNAACCSTDYRNGNFLDNRNDSLGFRLLAVQYR